MVAGSKANKTKKSVTVVDPKEESGSKKDVSKKVAKKRRKEEIGDSSSSSKDSKESKKEKKPRKFSVAVRLWRKMKREQRNMDEPVLSLAGIRRILTDQLNVCRAKHAKFDKTNNLMKFGPAPKDGEKSYEDKPFRISNKAVRVVRDFVEQHTIGLFADARDVAAAAKPDPNMTKKGKELEAFNAKEAKREGTMQYVAASLAKLDQSDEDKKKTGLRAQVNPDHFIYRGQNTRLLLRHVQSVLKTRARRGQL